MTVGRYTRRKAIRCRRINGFTLVELLVVFALLALLLSIAVPKYLNATQGAGLKVRAQNLSTLRDAIDKFHADQGRYPDALAELVQKQYLRTLPYDPVSGTTEWVPVKHPMGESGIYDVHAPSSNPETGMGSTGQAPAAASEASK